MRLEQNYYKTLNKRQPAHFVLFIYFLRGTDCADCNRNIVPQFGPKQQKAARFQPRPGIYNRN